MYYFYSKSRFLFLFSSLVIVRLEIVRFTELADLILIELRITVHIQTHVFYNMNNPLAVLYLSRLPRPWVQYWVQ